MGSKRVAFAALFLALALSSLVSAACPTATRNIYLAAVTGENSGGIFQLSVEVRPGNGSVYTAVMPRTGYSTQESEETAVDYAFWRAQMNRSECDVLFRMNGPFNESTVDGPSAGGAMTLATLAALTNKSIRQDVVMTGTISPEGSIGAVGGIIEKSVAAADAGAKYFISPRLQVYESLLIASVSRTKDFHAIEVESVDDASAVLFSDYAEKFASKFSPESKPVPKSLKPIEIDPELGRFTLVTRKVVDALDLKVKNAFVAGTGTEETKKLEFYFKDEIAKYRKLLSMGYPFTAANSAFLLSIDAEYVAIGDSRVDLGGSISEVQSCIKSINAPAKTKENFHWAIGADLRRLWAMKKLNETLDARAERGGYNSLRDLLFTYSWCGISKDLAMQADDVGGASADERLLSRLANERLREAEEILASSQKPDYDAAWHLENGLDANLTGEYGAAIYEAAYAKSMQEATDGTEKNVSAAAEKLASGSRDSLWGKIYYGQGRYLYTEATDGKFLPTDAYRILKYSQELDRASAEIDRELAAQPQGAQVMAVAHPQKPAPTEYDLLVFGFLASCVALIGFAAAYRMTCKYEMNIEKIFIK